MPRACPLPRDGDSPGASRRQPLCEQSRAAPDRIQHVWATERLPARQGRAGQAAPQHRCSQPEEEGSDPTERLGLQRERKHQCSRSGQSQVLVEAVPHHEESNCSHTPCLETFLCFYASPPMAAPQLCQRHRCSSPSPSRRRPPERI